MPTVNDVISVLERFAPPSLAAAWDNTGLLLGDRTTSIRTILACLTLTGEVADEAAKTGTNLIVTHHPILFRGAKRLTADTAEGQTLLTLTRNNIAVYSPHTAFDDCPGGINDQLASLLGLTDVRALRDATGTDQCKLVVFVPESDLSRVSDAIFAAGAGVIGQYRECSFRLAGTGTFFGSEAANPTVGQKGRREDVSEWRLETVCPKSQIARVVDAMRAAHSYEEPAFDVYQLMSVGHRGGSGRVGILTKPHTVNDLASALRTKLRCGPVQLVGDSQRIVERVAIACGAAGEFLDDAREAGADVFVTGEMRFHDYLAAQAAGVSLILPGHYATERFAVEWLAEWLQANVPGVSATASRAERDPVNWV